MSIRINLPDDDTLATVQARFTDEDNLRQTMAAMQDASPGIAFSRLYQYARGDISLDTELLAALKQDKTLARDFNALLQKLSWDSLPQVAAASTDSDLRLRETDLCTIRIEPSRAEPDQVYVILELKDPAASPPDLLITSAADGAIETLALPQPDDGIIQLLLQADAAILLAMQDHATWVFLR